MTTVPSRRAPGPARLSELMLDALGAYVVFAKSGQRVRVDELVDVGTRYLHCHASNHSVALVMANDRVTVEMVLGAIAVGCRLVSLPAPPRGDGADYAEAVRRVLVREQLETVIVPDAMLSSVGRAGLHAVPHSQLVRNCGPLGISPEGFRLVQHTSGSTGTARGVLLTDQQLGSNVEALLAALDPVPGDHAVSWLPLSHDMGLVGMLLTSVCAMAPNLANDGNVVLLEPQQFLRDPSCWLDALVHWRATFTAAPDFGFRIAAGLGRPWAGDLSHLRCAILGGEIIRAATLEQFSARFTPNGFEPHALCPAYGMAELGLAATLTRPGATWRERSTSAGGLGARQLRAPQPGHDPVRVVAAGEALEGYAVSIDDSDDIGLVRVAGPSIGTDAATGDSLASEGWLATNDLGFLEDGWLFLCGRADDHVVAHGLNLHAPTIESRIRECDGVLRGRVAVIDTPDGGWAVLYETRLARQERGNVERSIRNAVLQVVSADPTALVAVRRGGLPFTDTGKLRRAEARRRYLAGELA